MNANAGELLRTMQVRLKMQQDGVTNPPDNVKGATQALVQKLAAIAASEEIEVTHAGSLLARYIRASTGEVLAEIYDERNT